MNNKQFFIYEHLKYIFKKKIIHVKSLDEDEYNILY